MVVVGRTTLHYEPVEPEDCKEQFATATTRLLVLAAAGGGRVFGLEGARCHVVPDARGF